MSASAVSLQFAFGEDYGTNTLSGQVSVSLTLGTISFDTGVVPAMGDGNNFADGVSIPITGSYTLDTGGDDYTGPLNYSLELTGYTRISSVTSTALAFSQWSVPGFGDGPYVASLTASNGFQLDMRAGANDNTYYYSWQYGPITADVVPEPSSLLLLVLGATSLTLLHMRERQRRTALPTCAAALGGDTRP